MSMECKEIYFLFIFMGVMLICTGIICVIGYWFTHQMHYNRIDEVEIKEYQVHRNSVCEYIEETKKKDSLK